MKKLLLFLVIAPLAAFAQLRVPNFPTDSAGHIQYQEKFDFPGSSKKKIFDVMAKWLSGGLRGKSLGVVMSDTVSNSVIATVAGTIDAAQSQAPLPFNSDAQYILQMVVVDEHATITINNFEIKTPGGLVPLETIRDKARQTHAETSPMATSQKLTSQQTTADFQKNVVKSYQGSESDGLDNIDQTAKDMLKDAAKYVKKVKKQNLI